MCIMAVHCYTVHRINQSITFIRHMQALTIKMHIGFTLLSCVDRVTGNKTKAFGYTIIRFFQTLALEIEEINVIFSA